MAREEYLDLTVQKYKKGDEILTVETSEKFPMFNRIVLQNGLEISFSEIEEGISYDETVALLFVSEKGDPITFLSLGEWEPIVEG